MELMEGGKGLNVNSETLRLLHTFAVFAFLLIFIFAAASFTERKEAAVARSLFGKSYIKNSDFAAPGRNKGHAGDLKSYFQALYDSISLSSFHLNFNVFEKALTGYYALKAQGVPVNHVVSIVDFDQPSVDKRLWVLDLAAKKVLFYTLVAHGKNSGENVALHFSNKEESNESSLGYYLTKNTYQGKHGLSLVLEGLDKGVNCNAEKRCIVMHGADYVCEDFIKCHGRLGRSHGCPAVPYELHDQIINTVKEGSLLYMHHSGVSIASSWNNQEKALEYLSRQK